MTNARQPVKAWSRARSSVDRVLASEAKGRWFDSSRARQVSHNRNNVQSVSWETPVPPAFVNIR